VEVAEIAAVPVTEPSDQVSPGKPSASPFADAGADESGRPEWGHGRRDFRHSAGERGLGDDAVAPLRALVTMLDKTN
jgi:hypothetical protein